MGLKLIRFFAVIPLLQNCLYHASAHDSGTDDGGYNFGLRTLVIYTLTSYSTTALSSLIEIAEPTQNRPLIPKFYKPILGGCLPFQGIQIPHSRLGALILRPLERPVATSSQTKHMRRLCWVERSTCGIRNLPQFP